MQFVEPEDVEVVKYFSMFTALSLFFFEFDEKFYVVFILTAAIYYYILARRNEP